jgi:hypothetical protein
LPLQLDCIPLLELEELELEELELELEELELEELELDELLELDEVLELDEEPEELVLITEPLELELEAVLLESPPEPPQPYKFINRKRSEIN